MHAMGSEIDALKGEVLSLRSLCCEGSCQSQVFSERLARLEAEVARLRSKPPANSDLSPVVPPHPAAVLAASSSEFGSGTSKETHIQEEAASSSSQAPAVASASTVGPKPEDTESLPKEPEMGQQQSEGQDAPRLELYAEAAPLQKLVADDETKTPPAAFNEDSESDVDEGFAAEVLRPPPLERSPPSSPTGGSNDDEDLFGSDTECLLPGVQVADHYPNFMPPTMAELEGAWTHEWEIIGQFHVQGGVIQTASGMSWKLELGPQDVPIMKDWKICDHTGPSYLEQEEVVWEHRINGSRCKWFREEKEKTKANPPSRKRCSSDNEHETKRIRAEAQMSDQNTSALDGDQLAELSHLGSYMFCFPPVDA